MPKPTKRLSKTTKTSSEADSVPAPFVAAPAELLPFLESLSKDKVYISHIDRKSAPFKRRIFSVPVLLNLSILALLLWRLYAGAQFYWALLLSASGHQNAYTISVKTSTWGKIIRQILWRTANFLLDYICVTIVALWPWSFFCERPGNPVRWRWNVGFRDAEVYIREGRGWGRDDLLGATKEEAYSGSKRKAGAESPFFKVRILPAIDKMRLREKTGYLLMDADWDLDFAAMVHATKLLDRSVLKEDMFEKCVWVWCPSASSLSSDDRSGQWAIWECWKLDEGVEGERRQKIVAFKDRLTAMGKENLFFRWIELIQYESSQPGGFTPERQVVAADKVKKLFEEQGVDFDDFIKGIGGLEGLPGYERVE